MSRTTDAHHTMRMLASQIIEGKTLNDTETNSLHIVRAYAEAMIEGGSLEAADIYNRAFGNKAA